MLVDGDGSCQLSTLISHLEGELAGLLVIMMMIPTALSDMSLPRNFLPNVGFCSSSNPSSKPSSVKECVRPRAGNGLGEAQERIKRLRLEEDQGIRKEEEDKRIVERIFAWLWRGQEEKERKIRQLHQELALDQGDLSLQEHISWHIALLGQVLLKPLTKVKYQRYFGRWGIDLFLFFLSPLFQRFL